MLQRACVCCRFRVCSHSQHAVSCCIPWSCRSHCPVQWHCQNTEFSRFHHVWNSSDYSACFARVNKHVVLVSQTFFCSRQKEIQNMWKFVPG